MTETRKCPSCGGTMRRDTRADTVTYRGRTVEYEQPAWWCDDCGDAMLEGSDNVIADTAFKSLRAAVQGVLSPLEVMAVREHLGLSQREAGKRIGGGPRAFHKYERGTVLPSRGVSTMLRVLAAHPDALRKLPTTKDILDLRKSKLDETLTRIVFKTKQAVTKQPAGSRAAARKDAGNKVTARRPTAVKDTG